MTYKEFTSLFRIGDIVDNSNRTLPPLKIRVINYDHFRASFHNDHVTLDDKYPFTFMWRKIEPPQPNYLKEISDKLSIIIDLFKLNPNIIVEDRE